MEHGNIIRKLFPYSFPIIVVIIPPPNKEKSVYKFHAFGTGHGSQEKNVFPDDRWRDGRWQPY